MVAAPSADRGAGSYQPSRKTPEQPSNRAEKRSNLSAVPNADFSKKRPFALDFEKKTETSVKFEIT